MFFCFFCRKILPISTLPKPALLYSAESASFKKGFFGQFNTLKFIYLRLDPLHPDNQTIKSLSVPPDNSGT